jgi:hypothetical protein
MDRPAVHCRSLGALSRMARALDRVLPCWRPWMRSQDRSACPAAGTQAVSSPASPCSPDQPRATVSRSRPTGTASVVPECAWPARRRFWIMSHQVQLSPAASRRPNCRPGPGRAHRRILPGLCQLLGMCTHSRRLIDSRSRSAGRVSAVTRVRRGARGRSPTSRQQGESNEFRRPGRRDRSSAGGPSRRRSCTEQGGPCR